VKQKLRSDSFAARLTPAQRDELFVSLAGGMSLADAAKKVHEWTKAEWGGKPPSTKAISAWFVGERLERRYAAAAESSIVAQANCPADYDAKARQAVGQAKYLATLEELEPRDVVAFLKLELDERKVALDEVKTKNDTRVQRRDLALARAKLLLERVKGGERSEDLQSQINLALEEIERMKHGEDA